MSEQDPRRLEWFRQRVEAVHRSVSAFDVLRHMGIELRQSGDDREEQIRCPFHGADNKPSARVYPDDVNSKSHVWCYVCQEAGWDVIGLWKKQNDVTFGAALAGLERAFGLTTAPMPEGISDAPTERLDPHLTRFKKVYVHTNKRLIHLLDVYKKLGDRVGYLSAASILDKTKYRVDKKIWKPDKGVQVLETLLDRIQERFNTYQQTQAPPEGLL